MTKPRSRRFAGVLISALALLAVSATVAAAAPVLGPPIDYATGGLGGSGWHETSVAIADFNSDGRNDVVSADFFNFFTTTPGPLLQRGLPGGALQSPGTRGFPAGLAFIAYEAGVVVPGDYNNDGKQDLAVTNDYSLSILRGNGDGSFQAPITYTVVQGGQDDTSAADVNNDGNLDLVVLLRTGTKTFLGDGTGHFPATKNSTFGTIAMSGLEAANFDNDGKTDIAVTDAAQQKILALKGDGTGKFTQFASVNSAVVPGTVLTGDFNEDGRDDVAATNEFNLGVKNVVVALNNGSGGFGSPAYYGGGIAPIAGAVGDVNHDGHADLVNSDTIGSQEVVLLGDGNGGFAAGGSYSVGTFPQTPAVGDLSGDGFDDLAVAGASKSNYGPPYGPTQMSVLLSLP